jgi:site-specific DNA-methyltransferase (adenine-specific)
MIAWVYGSGFPKSLDVSKAIDKAAGEDRPRVAGGQKGANAILGARKCGEAISGEAISGEAQQWAGWGTALKPALEPITVARKPLIGVVAENVLQHGTGAINVDGGRVGTDDNLNGGGYSGGTPKTMFSGLGRLQPDEFVQPAGRWPANFIHDGSEEATDLLGASARFFYCAKASKADRDEGCEGLEIKQTVGGGGLTEVGGAYGSIKAPARNHHPTVKPTDLMRYLCRLVTPPSGIVLDPFMGSGSTGKAAMMEGFAFVGIEREAEYIDIAKARIQSAVGLL